MKVLVTEMPISRHVCPFSQEYTSHIWDEDMENRYKVLCYHCTVNRDVCDLAGDKCSGLKVLEENK